MLCDFLRDIVNGNSPVEDSKNCEQLSLVVLLVVLMRPGIPVYRFFRGILRSKTRPLMILNPGMHQSETTRSISQKEARPPMQ
jgi:hypothetical protein